MSNFPKLTPAFTVQVSNPFDKYRITSNIPLSFFPHFKHTYLPKVAVCVTTEHPHHCTASNAAQYPY